MRIKNYYLHILSMIILLILAISSITTYILWDKNTNKKSVELYNIQCVENAEDKKEFCERLNSEIQQKRSFFPMIATVLVGNYIPSGVIMILFIIIPSCYFITKYLRNRVILNENNRLDYKKSIINTFKKSYVTALIIPIIFILVFLVCYIYTGTFELRSFEINNIPWPTNTIEKPFIFLALYLLNYIMIGIIYVNCTLSISRKYHNYFISTILSFLLLLGIELFFEIVINSILCSTILHSDIGMIFNIVNPVAFNITYGFLPTILFSTVICLISFVPVIILYRDKERLIIDCEKNI